MKIFNSGSQSIISIEPAEILAQNRRLFRQCHNAWDPKDGRLSPCLYPYILLAPALVAGLVLLYRLLAPVLARFRPAWTKPFIVELSDIAPETINSFKSRTSWIHTSVLLSISAIGLGSELINALLASIYVPGIFLAISWAIAILLIAIDRPQTTPYGPLIIYVFILISRLTISIDALHNVRPDDVPHISGCLAACFALLVVVNMPTRDPSLPNDQISVPGKSPPTEDLRSPEDNITLLQFLTCSWMSPLISLGKSRQINNEDVWRLPFERQHRLLHDTFRELTGTPLRRLIRANGVDLAITPVLSFLEDVCDLSVPVLFQQLLRSMQDSSSSVRASVVFATLILISRSAKAHLTVMKLWYCRRCYERSRGELITMLYEKTLSRKIVVSSKTNPGEENEDDESDSDDESTYNGCTPTWSQTLVDALKKVAPTGLWKKSETSKKSSSEEEQEDSDKPASIGKLLNLMRNDVYTIAQRFWNFDELIALPIKLILLVVLIWQVVGVSSLFGVLAVVVAQIVNIYTTRALLRAERRRRIATDKKLNLISQFIQSIRHLRWESSQYKWLDKVMEARQKELALRVWSEILSQLIWFTDTLSSGMFPVLAFGAYTVWAKQPLTIDVAFPAIQLFEELEDELRNLADWVTTLLNSYVSIKRVNAFMAERDKQIDLHESLQDGFQELQLEKVSFAWPGETQNVLENLNLNFKPGLTVIFGKVAAGKSALLHGLLSELDMRSGQYIRPTEMPCGYCAQTPWLQSMSIRDNILFAKPYNEAYYKQVLDACALTADLASFKDKDLSNIGENGIGLSGGQRARVALARAIYSQSKFLFLDDPLSALDQDTAEIVVSKCFKSNLLKDKVVLLVTHRIDLCLDIADQIVEIDDGRARTIDTDKQEVIEHLKRTATTQSEREKTEESPGGEDAVADADKFIEDEHRSHGGVQFSVYWEYIKAGKLKWWLAIVLSLAFERLLDVGKNWFLKEWGEAYGERDVSGLSNNTYEASSIIRDPFQDLPSPEVNVHPWLLGFFAFGIAAAVANLVSDALAIGIAYNAGKNLFRRVIGKIGGATFRFYDITPLGRLMNRMTGDIDTVDGEMTNIFEVMAYQLARWVMSLIIIASATPFFFALAVALAASFVFVFLRFLPTSQNLRRLEMVSLSPLISNFGALVEGLTTVRAFNVQHEFQDRVISVVDVFQKHDHFYWGLQAWLTYRLGNLSAVSIFLLTLIALYTGVSPGLTAFVLTAANEFVWATEYLCRSYGKMQMEFTSVERVVELLNLEQEPPGSLAPPASWPSYPTSIEFENVTIRYAPHLEPALKDISIKIPGGLNTALVGRTGSGKSTLAMSILGTILPETGRILVQDIDVAEVDKQCLRQRLTFLPQDPMLLPGTMQRNLDPFEEQSAEACAAVLERICGRHGWTLDMEIEDGGKNLSQGQRQLVALARAVLRRSAVVILDEATASIDTETAVEMQTTLREELPESTVITIAHRLEALSNSDYCVVLENGRVSEQGPAREILNRRSGTDLI